MDNLILHIKVPINANEFPELVRMGIVEDDLGAYIVEEVMDRHVGLTVLDIGPSEDALRVYAVNGEIVGAEAG